MLVLARQDKEGVRYAPLYVHSFQLLQTKTLTESEKFNLRYPDPEKISTIADKLRYYRYKKSPRQSDVADRVGIDRTTYIRYEDGLEFYSLGKLHRIAAEVLEIEPEQLSDEYYRFLLAGQGKQLREYRRSRKLTQRALAQELGVHPGTVKRWESEGARIGKEEWERIRQAR